MTLRKIEDLEEYRKQRGAGTLPPAEDSWKTPQTQPLKDALPSVEPLTDLDILHLWTLIAEAHDSVSVPEPQTGVLALEKITKESARLMQEAPEALARALTDLDELRIRYDALLAYVRYKAPRDARAMHVLKAVTQGE